MCIRDSTGPKLDLKRACFLTIAQYPFLHPCSPSHACLPLSESMAATLGASYVQSRLDYANSIMYGMSASNMHKLQSAQNSLLVWFYLLLVFAIFQQVSDLVTSAGFLSTTEYSSKSLHLPIRPWQPVSHLISTISSNYTSHHELSILQPSNYSKYHICLQILVGTPSATALL